MGFHSKHIVSLRGSKFGSRVASLVANHSIIPRSGRTANLPNPATYGHYPGGKYNSPVGNSYRSM
jgi:hypothetical protein